MLSLNSRRRLSTFAQTSSKRSVLNNWQNLNNSVFRNDSAWDRSVRASARAPSRKTRHIGSSSWKVTCFRYCRSNKPATRPSSACTTRSNSFTRK